LDKSSLLEKREPQDGQFLICKEIAIMGKRILQQSQNETLEAEIIRGNLSETIYSLLKKYDLAISK